MKKDLQKFSFYKAPVTNKFPEKEINLAELYKITKSEKYKNITETFRQIISKQEATKYKTTSFDYVTFCGVFSERKDDCIKTLSGYMVLDIDNQNNVEEIKDALSKDTILDPLFMFTSPSGKGLKVVVEYDIKLLDNNNNKKLEPIWDAINFYLSKEYSAIIQSDNGGNYIDPSGKDFSRACFICYDKNVFINDKVYSNDR